MSRDVCGCVRVCVCVCGSRKWRSGLPGSSSSRRAPHSAEASGFPHGGQRIRGVPSKAVSRAQPARAAACVATTGFYLVQGGEKSQGSGQERKRGRARKRETWKMEKTLELVVDVRRAQFVPSLFYIQNCFQTKTRLFDISPPPC